MNTTSSGMRLARLQPNAHTASHRTMGQAQVDFELGLDLMNSWKSFLPRHRAHLVSVVADTQSHSVSSVIVSYIQILTIALILARFSQTSCLTCFH